MPCKGFVIAAAAAMLVPATAGAAPAPIDAVALVTARATTGKVLHVTEKLTVRGKLIGHDTISCVATSPTASRCSMTVTFAKGTVVAAGPISQKGATIVNGMSPAVPFRILRGTGAYAGATGTLILHFLSGIRTTERFSFT